MIDEINAFHAAIYDRPADPLPRLVYADWLDDHGEAEYAELIRLWYEIDRQANPFPKPLRDRRHRLVRALHDRWGGHALGFGPGDLFWKGVLRDGVRVDAFHLIHGWRQWPAYLRPRSLCITEYAGLEATVLATPPARHARELQFAGIGEPIWQPPYPPDSDPLMVSLSQPPEASRLRTLTLFGVRPSQSGLLRFAESALGRTLPEFGMSYALSGEECDEQHVEADQPPAGALAEAIGEFVTEFADRLPP